jgi:hypothetical protein
MLLDERVRLTRADFPLSGFYPKIVLLGAASTARAWVEGRLLPHGTPAGASSYAPLKKESSSHVVGT